jgi:hypothetical protein
LYRELDHSTPNRRCEGAAMKGQARGPLVVPVHRRSDAPG